MGINENLVIALTIVIASALAGVAGALLGPVVVLTPFTGASLIVKAFACVIIGGFGNMEGTIIAGLLVGFGTTLGSGCTSGHGVCGLARLSPRSLVAVLTFMASGFATVFVLRHVIGV